MVPTPVGAERFSLLFRPALGPTQPPVQLIPVLLYGTERQGRWVETHYLWRRGWNVQSSTCSRPSCMQGMLRETFTFSFMIDRICDNTWLGTEHNIHSESIKQSVFLATDLSFSTAPTKQGHSVWMNVTRSGTYVGGRCETDIQNFWIVNYLLTGKQFQAFWVENTARDNRGHMFDRTCCICMALYIPPWWWPCRGRHKYLEHKWLMAVYCLLRGVLDWSLAVDTGLQRHASNQLAGWCVSINVRWLLCACLDANWL